MRRLFSPSTPAWVVDYLTDWEEERTRHREDPLIIRRSVLRYVLAVEQEIIAFRRAMAAFETPYLLIYSELDPITPAWGNRDFSALTRYNHPDNRVIELAELAIMNNCFRRRRCANGYWTWFGRGSHCARLNNAAGATFSSPGNRASCPSPRVPGYGSGT